MRARLTSLRMHESCFLFQGFLVFKSQVFEEVKSLSTKQCHAEKMTMKLNLIEGRIAFSHTLYYFLARRLLHFQCFLFKEPQGRLQPVSSILLQHQSFLFQGMPLCAATIAPFDSNTPNLNQTLHIL